jgi:hypothetical protein
MNMPFDAPVHTLMSVALRSTRSQTHGQDLSCLLLLAHKKKSMLAPNIDKQRSISIFLCFAEKQI